MYNSYSNESGVLSDYSDYEESDYESEELIDSMEFDSELEEEIDYLVEEDHQQTKMNVSDTKNSIYSDKISTDVIKGDYISSFPDTENKKKLKVKTQEDIDFEKSQLLLINHDSIMKAALSPCCPRRCLVSISTHRDQGNYTETYELIKACRTELMGLNKDQRTDEIRNILRGITFLNIFSIIYIS